MKTLETSITYAAVALLAAAFALPAHAVYKCVDEKGITHYGDTMPPQCATKAITEMTKQGSVVQKIEAPLTPDQLKAQAAEAERRREHDKRITEQRLRDHALIATYGSEREFDMARDKDLAGLDARKRTLVSRNEEVDKLVEKHRNEMEFYKEGKSKVPKGKEKDKEKAKDGKETKGKEREVPPQVQADYDRSVADRANLDKELAKVDADRKMVTAKYESEKIRWKRLKSGMPAGTLLDAKGDVELAPDLPTQIVGQSTIIPGRPRGTATCDGKTYECSLGLQYLCRAPNIGGPGVNTKIVSCQERR